MIFIDASAMTAALTPEADSERVLNLLEAGGRFFTTPIAVYEAVLAVARISRSTIDEARDDVLAFLDAAEVGLLPISAGEATGALSACARFGKGRHKARLNMGDCFAYAVAKAHDAKILFVGDDFVHTDLRSALAAP
jgi:ribonuclease VapC